MRDSVQRLTGPGEGGSPHTVEASRGEGAAWRVCGGGEELP
jgi:hypothetical protein